MEEQLELFPEEAYQSMEEILPPRIQLMRLLDRDMVRAYGQVSDTDCYSFEAIGGAAPEVIFAIRNALSRWEPDSRVVDLQVYRLKRDDEGDVWEAQWRLIEELHGVAVQMPRMTDDEAVRHLAG